VRRYLAAPHLASQRRQQRYVPGSNRFGNRRRLIRFSLETANDAVPCSSYNRSARQNGAPDCQTYIKPGTPRIRDAPPTIPALPTEDVHTITLSKISWGAVFRGSGCSSRHPTPAQYARDRHWCGDVESCRGAIIPPPTSLSIGAGIWFAISGILGRPCRGLRSWEGSAGGCERVDCGLAWFDNLGHLRRC